MTGVADLASSKSSMEFSSPGGPTSDDTLSLDLSLSDADDMLMPSGPERIVNPTPENNTVDVGGMAAAGGPPEETIGMKPPREGGIGGMGGPGG